MANITIQQAYALALGAFVDFTSLGTRGSLSSVGLNARAISQKNNILKINVIENPTINSINFEGNDTFKHPLQLHEIDGKMIIERVIENYDFINFDCHFIFNDNSNVFKLFYK